MTDTRAFMSAVGEKFGAPWRVEERPGGFAAILDLHKRPGARIHPNALPNDYIVSVAVDEATRVFTYDAHREAGGAREREDRGPLSYSKSVDSRSYRGKRMAFSFTRTPDGLVPNLDDPFNTTAKEQQLVEIGQSLGYSLDESQAPALSLRVSKLPSKRMLVGVLIAIGAVFLVIGGVAVAIVATVLSQFAR